MKATGIISLISAACLSGACMTVSERSPHQDFVPIEGSVQDCNGNPINHIKVTITHRDSGNEPTTAYTSDKGRFNAMLNMTLVDFPILVDICLEDIDGEENGGLFETKTDRISIFEASDKGTISITTPVYQLTHAIDEESSRQSL